MTPKNQIELRKELRRVFSLPSGENVSNKISDYEKKIMNEKIPKVRRFGDGSIGNSCDDDYMLLYSYFGNNNKRVFAFASLSPDQRIEALLNGIRFLLVEEGLSADQLMQVVAKFLSLELGPPSSETKRSWKGHLPYPPKPKGLPPEDPDYADYQLAKETLRSGGLNEEMTKSFTIAVAASEALQYYRNNYSPKRKPQAPKLQEPKPKASSFKKK